MTVLVPIDSSENSIRALEFAVELAERTDTDLHTVHVTDLKTSTTENLLDLVEEEGYEHVVMGHHGSGLVGRAILGSTTETVVGDIDVPVTVIA